MTLTVNPLSEAIGAEVLGVDLSSPVAPAVAEQLNRALLDHIMIVVRDQHLSPDQYVRAMRVFGVPARQNHVEQLLDGHPEIWVIDSRKGQVGTDGQRAIYGANSWHTDHTNQQRPPKITALYAMKLPPSGGDTVFANAYRMFEKLPAETRTRVAAMRTVNGPDRHLVLRDADREAFSEPAVHPLVRRHPETGRQALYVHPLKTQHIEGLSPEESFDLVDSLIESTLGDDLTYRHRWRPGDLVLIDNRACLHRALRDYDPDAGRVMYRLIIEGDRPSA